MVSFQVTNEIRVKREIQNKTTEKIQPQSGYKKRRNRQGHIHTLLTWINGGTKKIDKAGLRENMMSLVLKM